MDRNRTFGLIIWLYDRLAGLYPPAFRRQFSAEQREVFTQALEDAFQAGSSNALRLLGREFADLPGVLARCYFAAFRQGGWEKILAGLALLALFGVPASELITGLLPGIRDAFGVIWIAVLIGSLLAGIVLGFPRWALPSLGFFLCLFSFYASAGIIDWYMRRIPHGDLSMLPFFPRVLYGSLFYGLCLMILIVITFFVFFLPRLIDPRRLPRIWRHPRRWSDASFVLYGGAVWLALGTLDEYTSHGPVILPAIAVLLLGAFFYLRAPTAWRGLRALFIGAAVAFVIIGVGKYWLVPLQMGIWKDWFINHSLETERQTEVFTTLMILVYLLPILLVPAAWRPFIEREPIG